MTTINNLNETVRGFQVIVRRPNHRAIRYPVLTGAKAIACMETLERRGFQTYAYTSGHGGEEVLTLKEMKESVIV